MMTLGYLVTVLAMIRVGEKLLQRYGARLPMMSGPVFTAGRYSSYLLHLPR